MKDERNVTIREETNIKYFKFELNKSKDGYIISASDLQKTPENIFIPKYYKGLPVTNIRYNGFSYCTNIKYLYIPNTIKSIDERSYIDYYKDIDNSKGSFCGCISLNKVEFEEKSSLEYIGRGTFLCCSNLESIVIPEHVKYIGQESFSMCFKLKSVFIDNVNMPVLGDDVFKGTSKFLKVYIKKY